MKITIEGSAAEVNEFLFGKSVTRSDIEGIHMQVTEGLLSGGLKSEEQKDKEVTP